MTTPALSESLLERDVELLHRLRADGLLLGIGALDALVAIRRARSYGEGGSRLVAAIKRLEAAPVRLALVPQEPRPA